MYELLVPRFMRCALWTLIHNFRRCWYARSVSTLSANREIIFFIRCVHFARCGETIQNWCFTERLDLIRMHARFTSPHTRFTPIVTFQPFCLLPIGWVFGFTHASEPYGKWLVWYNMCLIRMEHVCRQCAPHSSMPVNSSMRKTRRCTTHCGEALTHINVSATDSRL